MTEAEWLVCEATSEMFIFLGTRARGRKADLYWCGLLRVVWDRVSDADFRHYIAVKERFADGSASQGRTQRRKSCLDPLVHVWEAECRVSRSGGYAKAGDRYTA